MGPGVRRDDVVIAVIHFKHTHTHTRSRDTMRPSCCIMLPQTKRAGRPSREGAGKTGCTLHPRSRVQRCASRNAHEHTGSAEAIRPSLRNGFTAYFVLSLATGLFCHHRQRDAKNTPGIIANLTPATRRQDHTTSPYESRAVRLRAAFVHRILPQRW